jgi:hypothetical protein
MTLSLAVTHHRTEDIIPAILLKHSGEMVVNYILRPMRANPAYKTMRANPAYKRRVDSSSLVFSLSSDRHSYIGLVFNSRFIDS